MPEYVNEIDIGNRAAQHCGAELMDPTLGFTEDSRTATQIGPVYGKVRRAELRRNVWRFATRDAMLRPIDSNTMLLAPTLWVQGATYFRGSVVSDDEGTLWVSLIPNNTGTQPGTLPVQSAWAPYFGPMTVALYDSSQGYGSGELVYTIAGNGTYNVYLSLLTGNAVHPALSNQWSISTVYFKNQVVQQFPAWAIGTTYSKGQGVLYTDGNVYASLTNSNLGNAPAASPTNWALVPVLTLKSQTVPVTGANLLASLTSSPVLEWAQATTYGLGSVVMFNGSEYLSLLNNNTGNFPNAAASTDWVQITNGTLYMSLIDLNLGNSPATSPAPWNAGTTYASGNQVAGSDGQVYTSAINSNLGNNPTTSGPSFWTPTGTLAPWTTVFTQGGGNSQWVQIGGASAPDGVGLTTLDISIYPIGAGPLWQSNTRNVFRLPAGYLMRAPRDPKAGSASVLGAPSNLFADDYLFEGNYMTSMSATPIFLRFVADVTDVTQMDDMFCEGLAARIAEEVCQPLTQSSAKLADIRIAYDKSMGEARIRNAIEVGAEEPPLDDWISCRY